MFKVLAWSEGITRSEFTPHRDRAEALRDLWTKRGAPDARIEEVD